MAEQQPTELQAAEAVVEDAPQRKPRRALLFGMFAAGAALSAVTTYLITNETNPEPTRPVAVAGTVKCPEGQPVTGVWVEPMGGGGRGWARWQAELEQPNVAAFGKAIDAGASSYRLSVGCGGTPREWEHDNRSQQIPNTTEFIVATCVDKEGIKNGACTVVTQ